jgi:hypothetical protein
MKTTKTKKPVVRRTRKNGGVREEPMMVMTAIASRRIRAVEASKASARMVRHQRSGGVLEFLLRHLDRTEIDPRYLIRPYYLRPDGKVGHDAFAVIRETIREMNKVAIGRVVLTNREHIIDEPTWHAAASGQVAAAVLANMPFGIPTPSLPLNLP